jgi:hypothetical protein
LPKAGLDVVSISSCFANQLQLSGRRNSIEQQMLSSAIEQKSASVSADGTQNIPPSAIPSRYMQLVSIFGSNNSNRLLYLDDFHFNICFSIEL